MSDKKERTIERVLQVAAQVFGRRPFAEVPIGEIAAAAHCSTATIYDIFGSKDELFRAATERSFEDSGLPRLRPKQRPASLLPLLDYLERRMRFLSSPQTAAGRMLTAQLELAGDIVRDNIDREYDYAVAAIGREVSQAMAAGLLRTLEVEAAVFVIMACTAYEPVTRGFFYAEGGRFDIADILRKSLAALVTETGAAQLEGFLTRLAAKH